MLRPLPQHERLPLECHQIAGGRPDWCQEHLLDPRHGPQRGLAQPGGLRRHDTPPEHGEALLRRQLLNRGPRLERVVPLDGQEGQPRGVAARLGQREPRRGRRAHQEAVGHLDQDPGAVARLDLGPGRAAVRQSLEHGEAASDDLVVRAPVQVRDHADAA